MESSSNDGKHESKEPDNNKKLPVGALGFNLQTGHKLLFMSIPLCGGAYVGYRRSRQAFDDIVRKGLSQPVQDLSAMDEGMRRALGTVMAIRAFGIATMGTVGCFALAGAGVFYVSGCRSTDELMVKLKAVASSRRQDFDAWIGIQKRVQDSSPDTFLSNLNGSDDKVKQTRLQQFVHGAKAWSSARRQDLDKLLGIEKRAQDHPDIRQLSIDFPEPEADDPDSVDKHTEGKAK